MVRVQCACNASKERQRWQTRKSQHHYITPLPSDKHKSTHNYPAIQPSHSWGHLQTKPPSLQSRMVPHIYMKHTRDLSTCQNVFPCCPCTLAKFKHGQAFLSVRIGVGGCTHFVKTQWQDNEGTVPSGLVWFVSSQVGLQHVRHHSS